MTPTPYMDCDSMCSMSLTVVVNARSLTVTTLFSMSSGAMPVNDQITVTTGISTLGKISVGMRCTVTTPNTTSKSATITKVYGRRSAKRTIHITLTLTATQKHRRAFAAVKRVGQEGKNFHTASLYMS